MYVPEYVWKQALVARSTGQQVKGKSETRRDKKPVVTINPSPSARLAREFVQTRRIRIPGGWAGDGDERRNALIEGAPARVVLR